jgi:predicted  nucleic acid-binding Zn-ribbon protein
VRSKYLVLALLALTLGAPPAAKSQRHRPPQIPEESPDVRQQREQAKRLNQARQEALRQDTAKLLQLSTELKEYVDKSSENTLSLDVIKKAEQIEKLAHSVKEKMKGTY